MTDRELMQMALDALEEAQDYTSCPTYSPSMTQQCATAAAALRARLAQPDHSEDKLEMVLRSQQEPLIDMSYDAVIKRCLPEKPKQQPEPEPVAWMHPTSRDCVSTQPHSYKDAIPLYTAPPQREWQGLTDEEIHRLKHHVDWTAGWTYGHFARAVESALKEKNT